MTEVLQNQYHPNDVSPPGETLLETIEAIGMPRTELAMLMGQPVHLIHDIIQAKAAITEETALQFEQVLQMPASFWMNRERRYQELLA